MLREIKELRQTCEAAPSQWEGELYDGRGFYVRYRYGNLQIHLGEIVQGPYSNPEIFRSQIGDDLDGVLSWKTAEKFLAGILEKEADEAGNQA